MKQTKDPPRRNSEEKPPVEKLECDLRQGLGEKGVLVCLQELWN